MCVSYAALQKLDLSSRKGKKHLKVLRWWKSDWVISDQLPAVLITTSGRDPGGSRPVLDSCSKANIDHEYVWAATKNCRKAQAISTCGFILAWLTPSFCIIPTLWTSPNVKIRNWETFGARACCWPAITGIIRYSPQFLGAFTSLPVTILVCGCLWAI